MLPEAGVRLDPDPRFLGVLDEVVRLRAELPPDLLAVPVFDHCWSPFVCIETHPCPYFPRTHVHGIRAFYGTRNYKNVRRHKQLGYTGSKISNLSKTTWPQAISVFAIYI